MKLLFHCCCAPCTAGCIESFTADSIMPVLFWHNPNIHPFAEYQNRCDSLLAFAAAKSLPLETVDEYGLRFFLRETHETEAPERCEICYRLRLEKTASHAAEQGFDAFGTSLLISPYQRHEEIRRIGEEMAARYGVEFFYRDFRPLFREGQAQARSLGLYMQKYCGCIFSEAKDNTALSRTVEKDQHGLVQIKAAVCGRCGLALVSPAGGEKNAPREAAPVEKNQHDKMTDPNLFQRLALIAGEEIFEKLTKTSVLVFGLGGVGSWCAEALVRSGIGKIGIVDFDTVCASNVNRQAQATNRTLGLSKTEAMKQRLLEINPNCDVSAHAKIFSRETAADFGIEKMDYVIDAIDSLPYKLDLIETSCAAGVKLFSSMGMANKIDPSCLKTAVIWETHGDPLARLVRHGLRKRGFSGDFTAVYSDEPPIKSINTPGQNLAADDANPYGRKRINGSAVTVTASAGLVLASLVLRDIMGMAERRTAEQRVMRRP